MPAFLLVDVGRK